MIQRVITLARNCSFARSVIEKNLVTEKSQDV